MEGGMTLWELIKFLKCIDGRVKYGFGNPHSYRGHYVCLAFEPVKNVTVSDMLTSCEEALGETYTGWKGGEFSMDESSECFLAYEGSTGRPITVELLNELFDLEGE